MSENGLNIQIANFANGIPELANSINAQGANFANSINGAMVELRNLNAEWKGKRYSDLIKAFNQELPKFNNMIELLRFKLPTALNQVAENYAAVNGDSNYGRGSTVTEEVTPVEDPGETGMMRYVLDGVISHKNAIEEKFREAQGVLNTISSSYVNESSMSSFWSSNASRVYINDFELLKSQVNQAINNLLQQFNELMTTAAKEIAEAEGNSSAEIINN